MKNGLVVEGDVKADTFNGVDVEALKENTKYIIFHIHSVSQMIPALTFAPLKSQFPQICKVTKLGLLIPSH